MSKDASSHEALKQITLVGEPEHLEAAGAALFEAGAGGLVEGPGEITVYAQSDEELSLFVRVAEGFPQLELEVSEVATDWQNTWQSATSACEMMPTSNTSRLLATSLTTWTTRTRRQWNVNR